MPSLGPLEMLVVATIALLVFGPQRLPEIARTIGRVVSEFRRQANELTGEFRSGLDLDDLDDLDDDSDGEASDSQPFSHGASKEDPEGTLDPSPAITQGAGPAAPAGPADADDHRGDESFAAGAPAPEEKTS